MICPYCFDFVRSQIYKMLSQTSIGFVQKQCGKNFKYFYRVSHLKLDKVIWHWEDSYFWYSITLIFKITYGHFDLSLIFQKRNGKLWVIMNNHDNYKKLLKMEKFWNFFELFSALIPILGFVFFGKVSLDIKMFRSFLENNCNGIYLFFLLSEPN